MIGVVNNTSQRLFRYQRMPFKRWRNNIKEYAAVIVIKAFALTVFETRPLLAVTVVAPYAIVFDRE